MKHILKFALLFLLLRNSVLFPETLSATSQESFFPISLNKVKMSDNNGAPGLSDSAIPVSFSIKGKQFRSCKTTRVHRSLDRMSTEELLWYFATLHYTEDEILGHPLLYMHDAYLAIAKQLPRYPKFVERYYHTYKNYGRIFSLWERMHFRYKKGLKEQFVRLWQECKEHRKAQEKYEQELRFKQEQEARELKNIVAFAQQYGITKQQITNETMDCREHQLHTEFVSHIHSAIGFKKKYNIQEKNIFIDFLGNGIAIGIKSNQLHNLEWATKWAAFGREAVEIIRGIGDGILLGSYNTVDMVMHPVRTLTCMVDGIRMLGSLTARTIGTLAHFDSLIEQGEYLQFATEVYDIGEQCVTLANSLKEQVAIMSNRDIAKHITAFGTEWVLTGQMFSMGHILCSNAGQVVQKTVRFLQEEQAGEFVLATVDGVLVRAFENVNKTSGGVGNIVGSGRELLEIACAEYMTGITAELEMLQSIFNNKIRGVADLANKYIKVDCRHILGIDLSFNRRGLADIGGFHHDLMGIIERSNLIKFINKRIYESGFYKADLMIEGITITKSFFPSEWSREKVISKIYEAYENFIKSNILPPLGSNGKYIIQSHIKEGIEIKICINQKGKILTAYPILK